MSDQVLKKTPLYELHKLLGAKFTPFGGWEMPVQYSGLVDEHHTVRTAVALFDVSHMGEVLVEGSGALSYLERITCNNVGSLAIGQAQYSMFLNEQGGVVDDIIIYRLDELKFLLCVNASNTAKDFAWMKEHQQGEVELANVSEAYAQLAIQGPRAQAVLELCLLKQPGECNLETFPAFSFQELPLAAVSTAPKCIIARTGYTGEDGFELFCSPDSAMDIAQTVLELGQSHGIKPAGLGARDTLRLEACYPLHGHEISDTITPLEAGLGWVVKLDKGDFIGCEALKAQKSDGLKRALVGLEVLERGIVREGSELFVDGEKIGYVCSGTQTPTVNKAIALAYVPKECAVLGTEIDAAVRSRKLKTRVVKKPFYRRPK